MKIRAPHLIFTACILIGAALIFLAPRIADEWSKPGSPQVSSSIGSVEIIEGRAKYQSSPLSEAESITGKFSLAHQSSLILEVRASAKIDVAGYLLSWQGPGRIVGELWSAQNPAGPIILHLQGGTIQVEREGTPGQLYVVRGTEMTDPRGAARDRLRGIAISPLLLAGKNGTEPPPTETAEPQAPLDRHSETDPDNGTLSNDYLDQRILQEKAQFQRCQSNSLRDATAIKGQLMIGLTINPDGRIAEARIVTTTIQNENLEKCILEIFKRIRFKSFHGSPIVRGYPLNFE
jgi:hypothetical protein